MSASIRDYDMTLEELVAKYGPLTLKDVDWVDRTVRVRRINHTRANGDFMDEMQAGLQMTEVYPFEKLLLILAEKSRCRRI
jgi:hypothetical protein